MKHVEAKASAKPRREECVRSLSEAHCFELKIAGEFVASFNDQIAKYALKGERGGVPK